MPGARNEIVEATRDLIGVVRALALFDRDPQGQERLAQAALQLEDAMNIFAIDDPGSPEYDAAIDKTRAAIQTARSTIHMNNGLLAMLLGGVAKRLRELQGRSW